MTNPELTFERIQYILQTIDVFLETHPEIEGDPELELGTVKHEDGRGIDVIIGDNSFEVRVTTLKRG